jgi:hypothetical protein
MEFAELRTASSSPLFDALSDLINADLIRPAHEGVESMLSLPLGTPLLLSPVLPARNLLPPHEFVTQQQWQRAPLSRMVVEG